MIDVLVIPRINTDVITTQQVIPRERLLNKISGWNYRDDLVSRLRIDMRYSDRKSTRLNSSHLGISYAVFCLKKNTKKIKRPEQHATILSSTPVTIPYRRR